MWKKGIRVIVSFVVVLLVWQIACTVTNANATLFPSPVKVGEEFVKLFTQGLEGSTSHGTLPGHIRISLLRFATGYVLAAVSAILLGLILGSLPKVFQFINPILQIIRPIAPVAFLPFIVFWFGIGDVPAIVIIFIAGFFPILLSVVAAVQHVDGIYYKIADSFGVGKVKTGDRADPAGIELLVKESKGKMKFVIDTNPYFIYMKPRKNGKDNEDVLTLVRSLTEKMIKNLACDV